MRWETAEYEYREKSADWFWGVGLGALLLAIVAIVFGNLLFGIFVVIAGLALILQSLKQPHVISYEITDRGVVIDKTRYPFSSLESFWVTVDHGEKKLLLKSERTFMPLIVIPLGDISGETVRDFLLDFLPEEEQTIPLSERIMDFLGF